MSALASLSPRERMLLLVGAVLILALVLWRFAWQPIQAERAALNDDIARYLALRRVAELADVAPGGTAQGAAEPAAPLSQRATRSAESAGVRITRIDPQGARLTLVVQDAAFRDILAWTVALEREEYARVTALEVDRQTAPGTVSARLTLEDAR
ncbi:Type II secretion system protein M [Roseivivax jejudonensis]|uniref:Type II secretion system protein M n=1 Tax=Roseivivax jejudonensis TaxID=1529041 RepID=A0A1X6Y7I9_9RHOB|nr:type II secretion system protein M [Roseivivax jejudonensis]SLN13006.1 Type II secretion system protein M [Roseivivax jejudonensis]